MTRKAHERQLPAEVVALGKQGHPPTLVGWIEERGIRGLPTFRGRCERCGRYVVREATFEIAEKALHGHREKCRPKVPVARRPDAQAWGVGRR